MKAALILLFIALVSAQVTFKANANVTLVEQANYFSYRQTSTSVFNIPLLYSGLFVSSNSLQINPNSAALDGLFGSAYAGANTPPSSYLAFYDVAANWQVTANAVTANATSSKGFIGSVYISLDELNPQGTVVKTIPLKSLAWITSSSNVGNGGLLYATFKGQQAFQNPTFSVSTTFVVSDVVGLLDVVGTGIVTPKSITSIIEINNFPYANNANQVRLNMGVGTAASSATAYGTFKGVVSGTGDGSAYFTIDNQAQVNGQATSVQVSGFTDVQGAATLDNNNIVAQVTGRYQGGAQFKLVSVTFPAGATQIKLDPIVGAGSPPPQPAGVGKLAPSVFLLVLALCKLFF